jgi:hypothetical protein
MNLQRIPVQRIGETAPTPFGAGAQTVDARLGHPPGPRRRGGLWWPAGRVRRCSDPNGRPSIRHAESDAPVNGVRA